MRELDLARNPQREVTSGMKRAEVQLPDTIYQQVEGLTVPEFLPPSR